LLHTLETPRSAGVFKAALLMEPQMASIYTAAVGHGALWGMAISYARCELGRDVRGAPHVGDFIDDERVLHADA